MQTQKKLLRAWEAYGTECLQVLFVAVLIMRFLFPFFHNPIDRLGFNTDMQRHVDNGFLMLYPNFDNGIDPKTYQLWMHLQQLFPTEHYREFSALFAGLLCAGMAWCWYRALREITTRRKALALGIGLGLHPSFLVPYAFYLIETMALTTTSLAVWTMLRAVRKRTLAAFALTAFCWILAGFSKQTVLPMMLLGVGYALSVQPRKLQALALALAMFAVALIPAGWQSMRSLHFFSPFGYIGMETLCRKSNHTYFIIYTSDGPAQRSFTGYIPSFQHNPLDPLGNYTSSRSVTPYIAHVDLAEGRAGWNKLFEQLKRDRSWHDVLRDYEENFIFLFFSQSWEANRDDAEFLWRWDYHLRWLVFPCFLCVIGYGPFARMAPAKTWMLLVAFCLTWIFLLQDVGIVEGRYRKLIEPFLFLSVSFMFESLWAPADAKRVSMWGFVKHTYVDSLLRQLTKRASLLPYIE